MMSATGNESLRSSFSPSKLRVEHNVSEYVMIKKRKVNFSTPVVMNKKRMTGSAYKAKFKGQRRDKIVPVKLALSQTEKLTSYQEKEQLQSVNSREECLKRMEKQGSLNTIHSDRDRLVSGKNINQEISNVKEKRPPSSTIKPENSKREIVKDSAKEEHNENQIRSWKKQAVNDKGEGSQTDCFRKDSFKEEHIEDQMLSEQKQAVNGKGEESDIHCLLNKIQKNCRKRMVKLLQKQREQTQKFHQIWEKKRSNLERDYKLERSVIQSMHVEGATITNIKLKLLDDEFTKKMKEHDLLKDVELKKLEKEQLSAKDKEREKEARWLAACRSGEPTADHGPESFGLHSEEVWAGVPFGNSNSSSSSNQQNELEQTENIDLPQIACALTASKKSFPVEVGEVELNKEVLQEVPETVPNGIGDYANPVELSNDTSNEWIDKGDAIGLPNYYLVSLEDEKDVSVGLPLVEEIMEPSEQTKASRLPQNLEDFLNNAGVITPLRSMQESEDRIPCSSIFAVIQDIGAWVVEAQNSSPVELAILQSNIKLQEQDVPEIESKVISDFATTGNTDTVTPDESNVKLQSRDAPDISQGEVANLDVIEISHEEFSKMIQDKDASVLEDQATSRVEVANSEPVDIVNPVQSKGDAPEIQNYEEFLLIDESPCCDEPTSIEYESQSQNPERISSKTSQTAEISTTGITDTVQPTDSIVELQGQNAPVVEDQYVLQIENANSVLNDIVNPVQDQSSHVVEKHKACPFEVAASAHVQTVTVVQPNIELHDQDTSRGEVANFDNVDNARQDFVEKFQNQDALVSEDQANSLVEAAILKQIDIQNCEELVSVDISLCCSQPPSIEDGSQTQNLEKSSSQTAEIADAVVVSHESAEITNSVVVSHESASQLGGNLELQSNHLDIGSGCQVNLERNSCPTVENTNTVLPSSDTTSRFWGNRELPNNYFGVQLGTAGNYGSSTPFSYRQVPSLSSPPLYATPLQHELGKISKEIVQLQKSHIEMKSQLKSDREKEIREFLAQLDNKYNLKLQVAEAEFISKKNGLDKVRRKVFLNTLLAESFGSGWLRGIHQALNSRPPPMAMVYQPVVGEPITALRSTLL